MGENQFNYPGRGRECGQYILEGHRPVPCDDLLEWGRWLEQASRTGEKHVNETWVNAEVRVSTVFMGLDHGYSWMPHSRPLLFETMIFGGPLDMYQTRYSTWAGAEHGHNVALKACFFAVYMAGRRKFLKACSKEPISINYQGKLMYRCHEAFSPKSRIRLYTPSTI